MRGCAAAPAAIREAFYSPSANLFTESLMDLGNDDRYRFESVALIDAADSRQQIEAAVTKRLAAGNRVLSLGGDHSISYPILRAYAGKYGALNVVHLDAHGDLYDSLDGNRYSHACPFARAHEDGLIAAHTQLGIRTMTAHQQQQAERFGVKVAPMSQWKDIASIEAVLADLTGPTYLTIDLDVLDPAFAPGISHHEPGGASTRQVLELVQQLKVELVGADIVELNPSRDINGMTAMVAAKILKEVLSRMLSDE